MNETLWTQPRWLEQARAWIASELAARGRSVTGPIAQPHIRPWSTVLRVPTESGDVYFKAVGATLIHESALTAALARWRPDCLPTLLAADAQRGWMLMDDGGARLREIIRADRDLDHWEKLLPIYAELQIELAPRVSDLLALGVPDRRLAMLPHHFGNLLADPALLQLGQPGGLSHDTYRQLRAFTSQLVELCERLAACGIPESLHHGDFHDGNIFVTDGRFTFFDWGDASISHPFFSLRTTFVSVENSLQIAENAPEFDRLRDAYLEPWQRFGSRVDLVSAFRLAQRLSPLCSALSWQRAVSALDATQRGPYAEAIPSLLQEFLAANTTGET